jgi:hypothetical protein
MSRLLALGALALLAGCSTLDSEQDAAAVRAVTMSGPAVSWQELRVHPVMMQHACAVSTLVNDTGAVVGYCSQGRQCRTLDWRPIADGCVPGGPVTASRPQQETLPPITLPPGRDHSPGLDLAQRR